MNISAYLTLFDTKHRKPPVLHLPKPVPCSDLEETDRDDVYWNVGMSAERIQKALNKWKVDVLPDDLYRFMDIFINRSDDAAVQPVLRFFAEKISICQHRTSQIRQAPVPYGNPVANDCKISGTATKNEGVPKVI